MLMPDVAALMQRLLSDATTTRLAAQQEVQAWPPETLLAVLGQHWPEGYDLPVPEPSGLLGKWRRLLPTTRPKSLLRSLLHTAQGAAASSPPALP